MQWRLHFPFPLNFRTATHLKKPQFASGFNEGPLDRKCGFCKNKFIKIEGYMHTSPIRHKLHHFYDAT